MAVLGYERWNKRASFLRKRESRPFKVLLAPRLRGGDVQRDSFDTLSGMRQRESTLKGRGIDRQHKGMVFSRAAVFAESGTGESIEPERRDFFMGEKNVEMTYRRVELAVTFEKLAAQLRSGQFLFEEKMKALPENMDVRIHVKEKRGEMRFKLEMRWPLMLEPEGAPPEEAIQWRADVKQVKRDLARAFKQLKKSAARGITPNDPSLADFVSCSKNFVELAEADWQQAADEYLGHLENLVRAVEGGHTEFILHELDDLENRMVACHREFK